MELGEQKADFEKQGLGVAAVSYDSVAILKSFADRKHLAYPLLADPESKTIRAFGILNDTVPKGPFYGIPYPGTFVIDEKGFVTRKFFEKDYKERYSAGNVLYRISQDASSKGWQEVETKHLVLSYGATDTKIHGGDRTTVVLKVRLKPKMHVYAPGVQSEFIPVKWDAPPTSVARAEDTKWPAARTLNLKAIKEKAPVYEGSITVERDLTFAQQKQLQDAAGDSGKVHVESSFKYQACDDKVCYPPVTLPLKFDFEFVPHDSQRAPEDIRHK